MTLVKKLLIVLSKILLILFLAIAVYALGSITLSLIPVNSSSTEDPEGVEIYLLGNGVHVDLVLPFKNQYKNWAEDLNREHTIAPDSSMSYVAFGWGDQGFYLHTREWSELKFKTAFIAAFSLGESAMHVVYHDQPSDGKDCRKMRIPPDAYRKLVKFIEESFSRDSSGSVQWIQGHSYGKFDAFYQANGQYNLFKTCNTWTNAALKESGIKAALWTPIDKGVLYHHSNTCR